MVLRMILLNFVFTLSTMFGALHVSGHNNENESPLTNNHNSSENFNNKKLYNKLIKAARLGDKGKIKCLIMQGLDISLAVDELGDTALMWAVYNCDVELVRMLLSEGANVKHTNKSGSTPLLAAAARGDKEIVEMLLRAGAEVNCVNNIGGTALMYAAMNGYQEVVELLFERSAEVNVTTQCGQTALLWATSNGHKEVVKLLLDHDADVNFATQNGQTPLIGSAKNGYTKIIKMLIKNNVNVRNESAKNARCNAEANKHWEIVRLIEEQMKLTKLPPKNCGLSNNNN